MEFLRQVFSVRFEYKVFFTTGLFDVKNDVFRAFLRDSKDPGAVRKTLFVLDNGLLEHHSNLVQQIRTYMSGEPEVRLIEEMIILPGGEATKTSEVYFESILEAAHRHGIDRHSYLVAVGGGSVLDVAGYAAAVAHRGIRHIRIPTTVLSQNDSGVGVKNGINYFNKKNFLGTFTPPVAVFNDSHFLTTLSDAEWRSGISEAIKVALIKDAGFFTWLESNAEKMVKRDMAAIRHQIKRCSELHLQHIAGADPFESGSSRPLDFGHWSAHKLEQLSNFTIRHGEAVAIGIALDTVYSFLSGRLKESSMKRVLRLLKALGFPLTDPLLEVTDEKSPLLEGLNEFREHLGGRLTIMLLKDIGAGEEVHEIDPALVRQASEVVKGYSLAKA
ncbi:MAG: 3-dehydroquinate synthase [Cyclobacteriaceae bacterium]